MAYHNTEEPNKHNRQQQHEAKVLPLANTIAAATRIRQVFESKKLSYGILGGLEMLCLGHQREISGLHIAYEAKDLDRIKAKLQADRRVHMPEGMNPLIPTKLLVQTGPAYLDTGCTRPGTVEVHLIPSGSHGTPRSGTLADNLTLLSLRSDGILKTYKGLNMLYLMKTLLEYCTVANLDWEPRKDILFLCQHYREQVQSIRSQLDEDVVLNAFLRSPFFTRISSGDQHRCYQTLRAQDVSLPVQGGRAQPQPDLPRPRVASNMGPPTTGAVHASKPQKAISSQKRATYHSSPALEPATAPLVPNTGSSTQDSRNRYRRVTTHGKEGQPGHIPQARSISMQYRPQDAVPLNKPPQFASHEGRLPTVTSHTALGLNPQTTQTMRASSAGHPGYFAPRTSTNPSLSQQPQRQCHTAPQTPDIPLAYTQRQQQQQQQHTQALERLTNGPVPKQPADQNIPSAQPVQPRPLRQSTQQPQPNIPRNSAPGLPSQAHEQPPSPPPNKRKDSGSGLHIVGPEGLWAPSPSNNSTIPPAPKPATQPSVSTTNAPQLPRHNSSTLLAELSADIDDAIKTATTPPLTHSPVISAQGGYSHGKNGSVELPASLMIRGSQAIPASAVTGMGLGAERHTDKASLSAETAIPIPHTNASRYSSILSSFPAPTTATTAPAPAPTVAEIMRMLTPPLTPAPLAIYKAYQPLATMPALGKSEGLPESPRLSLELGGTLPASSPLSVLMDKSGGRGEAWLDAQVLAREYQMELPGFEEGYGSV
ncbi:hypothetical protein GMOD_00007394 [Pyrenophora seminiperda CCB06]|uniref:Uncharacterized protein n=1 Tax=Pyrenophora seminiperda CCB06 TaxID=1302712 RepID=A0A3M7MD41_9PLEO|nr:hypothetical protein GMOD_00007394 [Pyrenophora seminiperda CCB06]